MVKEFFMKKKLPVIGQWLGVLFLGFGCGYEIVFHAEIGYIIITLGSLIFTICTKWRYYQPKAKSWLKSHLHL
jgi:hypothetical protein